ncbi:MAG: exodeoxyribonuclease VII small subunit [Clostridiales Family XIII bacterium]|jgi:exodeoxyribonuclease VII small subunit|nr:exodeoxyribonuclease VII small subunit [Clostridiales Family XIII bacterium]
MTDGTATITFEEALEKLEEYATLLSKEGVTLEEAMRAYEEGVRCYDVCNRMLNEADQKIELLEIQPETGEEDETDD